MIFCIFQLIVFSGILPSIVLSFLSPPSPSHEGVSAVPEVFQYDLTALYADDITAETKTSDSKAVGTALGGKARRGMVPLDTGEVAVRCCILVATDGLFDMMTNDTAVDVAFRHWGDPAAAAEEMIDKTGRCSSDRCICIWIY